MYMSDEDEEIDSSLVIDGVENRKDVDTPLKWSQAITKPVCIRSVDIFKPFISLLCVIN